MNGREALRRYLEQRRELGESELRLDSLDVDDVMRLVGALGPGGASTERPTRASGRPAEADPAQPRTERPPAVAETRERDLPPGRGAAAGSSSDWRTALRATGAAPPTAARRPPASEVTPPSGAPPEPLADSPDEETVDMAERSRGTPPPALPPGGRKMDFAAGPTPPEAQTALSDIPTGLVVGGQGSTEFLRGPLSELTRLEEIAELTRACTRCRLYATATQAVPGEGNPNADFVCVGEAPGEREDETGQPFVGQSGQLLTKILAAINLSREDVFICNVIKHRPPANRNPQSDEVEACSPYLLRQLELVKPKVIVAFGTFAAQTLLETKLSLGKLRGSIHRYHGIPLVVTFHPAALLRNSAWKRPTWEDVQLARRLLDRPGGT